MVHNLLAQTPIDLGTFVGEGPLGKPSVSSNDPGGAAWLFSKMISNAIGVMTIVGFIWFLFVLFSGAIGWLGSGGDKQKLQNSQKQITNGLVGLVIIISAVFLTKIMEILFGIKILAIYDAIVNLW